VGGGVTTQYHTTGGVLQGWWSVIDGCTQLVLLGRQRGVQGAAALVCVLVLACKVCGCAGLLRQGFEGGGVDRTPVRCALTPIVGHAC
jgi:hypothetical protein